MAYQCSTCNSYIANSDTHICIYDRMDDLQRQNESLKAAILLWMKSFYCDGETPEKANLKEMYFNDFVKAVEVLDLY